MALSDDVDRALDPRKSLPEREREVVKLNEKHGREAVTEALLKATRREGR